MIKPIDLSGQMGENQIRLRGQMEIADMTDGETEPAPKPPLWIRAAVDRAAFDHEQRALGALWCYIGMTSDLAKVGDWFRTTLGARSIFVQLFDEGIRAFENLCAHRFYPLRTKDTGNGPVLCGFHHWRYNADGVAVGIPNCPEMFGKIPREMDARITRLEVETCGGLIFARFPSDRRDTLRDYLGPGYAILARLCSPEGKPHRLKQTMHAHWKFSHHISLDDYHIVAVHPTTYGLQGYLKTGTFQYHRFGAHSAHYSHPQADFLDVTERQCVDGTYRPSHYAIYNIFPNLVVTQFRYIAPNGRNFWFINVADYHAVAPDETEVRARFFHAPPAGDEHPWEFKIRPYVDPWFLPLLVHFASNIMNEDNGACEAQQSRAQDITAEQNLGAQELRVAWFEEAYTAALTGQPLPGDARTEATPSGSAGKELVIEETFKIA